MASVFTVEPYHQPDLYVVWSCPTITLFHPSYWSLSSSQLLSPTFMSLFDNPLDLRRFTSLDHLLELEQLTSGWTTEDLPLYLQGSLEPCEPLPFPGQNVSKRNLVQIYTGNQVFNSHFMPRTQCSKLLPHLPLVLTFFYFFLPRCFMSPRESAV